MKKIFSLLSLMILSVICVFAQSDVVSTGGTASGNGGTVTYTIGQVAVQSYEESGVIISEGVQQPYEIQIIGVDDYPGITLNAMVYPNPTVGNIQLTIYNEQFTMNNGSWEVNVFDMNGKLLFAKKIEGENTEIPMSHLAAGTYFVNVVSEKQVMKSFKVVKMAR